MTHGRPMLTLASTAATLVAGCSEGQGPANAAATPTRTFAGKSAAWDLFERKPLVAYHPATNDDTSEGYGVIFRTKQPLPRNKTHGTRGHITINGLRAEQIVTIGTVKRKPVCYEALVDNTDGDGGGEPPLFPRTPGATVTVAYALKDRATKDDVVRPLTRPADEFDPRKLVRKLGCKLSPPYEPDTL